MNENVITVYTEFIRKGGLILANVAREQIRLLEENGITQNGPVNAQTLLIARDGNQKYVDMTQTLAEELKIAYSSILSLLEAIESLLQDAENLVKGKAYTKILKNKEILRKVLINAEGMAGNAESKDITAAVKMLCDLIRQNGTEHYVDFDFNEKKVITAVAVITRRINMKTDYRYSRNMLGALKSICDGVYADYDMALCESLYSLVDFLNEADDIGTSVTSQPLAVNIMEYEEEDGKFGYTFEAKKSPCAGLYELKVGNQFRSTSKQPHFKVRTSKQLTKNGVMTVDVSLCALRDPEDIDFLIDTIYRCRIRNNVTTLYSETNNSLENLLRDSLRFMSSVEAMSNVAPILANKITKSLRSKSSHGITKELNWLAILMSPGQTSAMHAAIKNENSE